MAWSPPPARNSTSTFPPSRSTLPSASARSIKWRRGRGRETAHASRQYRSVSSPRKRGPIFQRPRFLARWVPAFAGTTAQQSARPRLLRRRRLAYVQRREYIGRIAEFAGDRDLAVLDHVIAVVLGKAAQHAFHPFARARALGVQVAAAEYPHAALVKEPVEQLLGRDVGIEQLQVLDRRHERAAFDPGVVLG